MMTDLKKFSDAMNNLKPDVQYVYYGGYPVTEAKFAALEWATGENENGIAITTAVNPHPELTWSAVNSEMTRLQTEYDAQDYARKRQAEYPDIYDYMDGIVKNDQTQIDKYIADAQAVKSKYPKGG